MKEQVPKLLSLIDGRNITIAPSVKIIPEDHFSTLLSLEELLAVVQKDALEYRKQVIQECEDIKTQAEKEGFEAGYNQWVEMVSKLQEEILKVREELQKSVISVALKAAKKIVTTELKTNPNVIIDIVTNTLKTVAQHKRIVLYVNKADLEAIEANKNNIKQMFENLESFSIRDREDVEVGGCVIETDRCNVDARIKQRFATLEAAIQALSQSLQKEDGTANTIKNT